MPHITSENILIYSFMHHECHSQLRRFFLKKFCLGSFSCWRISCCNTSPDQQVSPCLKQSKCGLQIESIVWQFLTDSLYNLPSIRGPLDCQDFQEHQDFQWVFQTMHILLLCHFTQISMCLVTFCFLPVYQGLPGQDGPPGPRGVPGCNGTKVS